jgi:hypothetical protein
MLREYRTGQLSPDVYMALANLHPRGDQRIRLPKYLIIGRFTQLRLLAKAADRDSVY